MSAFRHSLKPLWSGVVLTESLLPDGAWRDILALTAATCPDAQVIVMSRVADDSLWAEVLTCGAFDLLAKPLEQSEVIRVGTSAWRQSRPRILGAPA